MTQQTVRLAPTYLWLALLALPCGAQVDFTWTVLESPEKFVCNNFGRSMRAFDFNEDGFDDLLVMEPGACANEMFYSGWGWVFFGPSFAESVKFQAEHPVEGEYLGWHQGSVGDIDGDGAHDLLISSSRYDSPGLYTDVGRAHVFLGPDFTRDLVIDDPTPQDDGNFSQGNALVDLTGDGLDDILLGSPGTFLDVLTGTLEESGEVFFWDAATLQVSGSLPRPQPVPNPIARGDAFGAFLATTPIDADAVPDLLVAAPAVYECCPTTTGALVIISGDDFSTLQILKAPSTYKAFGRVPFVGDLTGDGISDLLITAPFAKVADSSFSGLVEIRTGPTFEDAFKTLVSPDPDGAQGFGAATTVADVDRDGNLDVLVGDTGEGPVRGERVRIFYGPDFEVVQSIGEFPFWAVGFGTAVSTGDFDGDGFPEIAVLAPQLNAQGTLYVYDAQTLESDVESLSASTGGVVSFTFAASVFEAGHTYVGVLGTSGSSPGVIPSPGVYVPLNPDAITGLGLDLLGSPILPDFVGVLDGAGQATFQLVLAPGPAQSLIGQTLTVAAVTIRPDGRLGIGSSPVEIQVTP